MKKTICSILAVFILTQLNCYSQEITRTSIKIDRIKQILEKTESDTVRILQLQNWSDIIFYSNPDLHLKLQTDIVNLCENNLLNPSNEKEKKWFEEQIWIAFDHIGSIYFYDYDEPVKALKFYLKSAEVLETLDHLNSSSITYDIIGNIYQQLGNYQKANR
ncbi:MAG: tetratricopeptide repeat protein, partial [Bacteroidota bacterium]|nr:tetratricopeptide repeat protein [Bacteroidota bacterium]